MFLFLRHKQMLIINFALQENMKTHGEKALMVGLHRNTFIEKFYNLFPINQTESTIIQAMERM